MTESQYDRTIRLERVSGCFQVHPLLRVSLTEKLNEDIQGLVESCFENLHRGGSQMLSRKHIPVLNHPHSEEFSGAQLEFLLLQPVILASWCLIVTESTA